MRRTILAFTVVVLAPTAALALPAVGALVGQTGRDGVGWVHTLGVRAPWRGRRVAASLLRHVFAAFAGKGMRAAALGVDSENESGATRLYSSVGMHVTHHYNSYVKVLPGRAS